MVGILFRAQNTVDSMCFYLPSLISVKQPILRLCFKKDILDRLFLFHTTITTVMLRIEFIRLYLRAVRMVLAPGSLLAPYVCPKKAGLGVNKGAQNSKYIESNSSWLKSKLWNQREKKKKGNNAKICGNYFR